MQDAVLKAVAGFINSDGGTLYVGIDDNRSAIGISLDGFSSEDKMSLYFAHMIRDKMGAQHTLCIRARFIDYHGKRIMVIDCKRSGIPAFAKIDGAERFFVRNIAETVELTGTRLQQYLSTRFR
jgi:predicted HTH transcriptional regulator